MGIYTQYYVNKRPERLSSPTRAGQCTRLSGDCEILSTPVDHTNDRRKVRPRAYAHYTCPNKRGTSITQPTRPPGRPLHLSRRGRGEYVLGPAPRRGGFGAGVGWAGLLLQATAVTTATAATVGCGPPGGFEPPLPFGRPQRATGWEMRVARWGRVRAGRCSTEAAGRDQGARIGGQVGG